jgi:replicative DNA helicase
MSEEKIKFDRGFSELYFIIRLMQDSAFATTIVPEFDKRWIKSKLNLTAAKLVMAFQSNYKRAMTVPELSMILKSVANKDNSIVEADYTRLIKNISDIIPVIHDDVLIDATNDFVRRQASWCAIIDNVNDIEQNPDATIDKCLERLNKVQQLTLDNIETGFDYFNEEEFEEHYDAITNPDKKIPTGWPGIDEVTHGGFYKEGRCLCLVAGQAGLGKSLCLSNLAVNFLKQDKVVVVISLEMSENIYAQRFDAHISNLDINDLMRNGDALKSRLKAFHRLHPDARLIIKEFPPHSISSNNIDQYMKILVEIKGIKPDVLIVDYLNLVKANHVDTSESLYLEGMAASEELRALSYKYEIPVISAVQINTAGMNNEDVGMQHVSNSKGIVMTCDYLHILTQSEEDQKNGVIRAKIAKNRLGGEVGRRIPFKLDPKTLVLTDLCQSDATNVHVSENTSPHIYEDEMPDLFSED